MNDSPFKDDPSDRSQDVSAATEYKEAPITFTLHESTGRQLEIKIVEPELDYPLPENDRLVITEEAAGLTDVVFKFNAESDRPYELYFRVMMGITYAADHLIAFGTPLEDDENLLNEYELEIVARGGVKAWIKMTQAKARLVVKYVGKVA